MPLIPRDRCSNIDELAAFEIVECGSPGSRLRVTLSRPVRAGILPATLLAAPWRIYPAKLRASEKDYVTTDDSDSVDVLVIGSGPSGAVVSHTLATRGFKVRCLEQGDWVGPSDVAANNPEWELLTQQKWAHDPNIRKLPSDYPINVAESDMTPVMLSAVGGSSIYFGALWPRLTPSDFRVRTLDGVADDWPIGWNDLTEYHAQVDSFIGVAGLEGNPAYPPGDVYSLPPHPLGKVGRKAAQGLNQLGWHWWPGTNAIPSAKHKLLNKCARYGTCDWGCPEGAKATFDIAYWPHALKAGAVLTTGARVRQIVLDEMGRARGAIWIDRNGEEHLQRASAVVLCANGIGTSRLLLLSSTNRFPDGLANNSGMVGRNLMLHPNCSVVGYYDEDLESWKGPAGELISSMQFYETDLSRGFVRGSKMHATGTPGPLLTCVDPHRSLPYDQLWGPAFHKVSRLHNRGIFWAANAEDLPELDNRVTLDDALTDSDGIPAPKVAYRLSENTRRILRFTVDRMTEAHEASGAVKTIANELWVDQPGHLLGTARMGEHAESSVVDSFGRTHDVPNLYIADGSIFVTSGSANPTRTICALALRIGLGIAENARHESTPS